LTRIIKHGICSTTRTPTFEDADLIKDGIDTEKPDIYAHEDVEIIMKQGLISKTLKKKWSPNPH
jgi:hypothetical protein